MLGQVVSAASAVLHYRELLSEAVAQSFGGFKVQNLAVFGYSDPRRPSVQAERQQSGVFQDEPRRAAPQGALPKIVLVSSVQAP